MTRVMASKLASTCLLALVKVTMVGCASLGEPSWQAQQAAWRAGGRGDGQAYPAWQAYPVAPVMAAPSYYPDPSLVAPSYYPTESAPEYPSFHPDESTAPTLPDVGRDMPSADSLRAARARLFQSPTIPDINAAQDINKGQDVGACHIDAKGDVVCH